MIGLDGASLGMVKGAIEDGNLPHFRMLLQLGGAASLESVLPYVTGPAWTSLFSGVNPGKHGLFDMYVERGAEKIIPTLPKSVPYLWDYLSWAGKRVAIMGVPLAYPAPELNGIFVSGRFVSELSFYPKNLASKYDLSGFDYNNPKRKIRFGSNDTRERSEFAEETLQALQLRMNTSIEISKAERWDAVISVDSLPDELLHVIYNWKPVILSMFSLFDKWLGEVMNLMSKGDTILVVSDHGFQDVFRTFYMREWLRRRRYIKEDSGIKARIKRSAPYRRSKPFVEKMKLSRLIWGKQQDGIQQKGEGTDDKHHRSPVNIWGSTGDHIWLKAKGEEESKLHKLRGRLMNSLESLKAAGYVKEIYDVSSIYRGPYISKLDADLLIEAADGVSLNRKKITYGILEHVYPKKVGGHKRDGIILLQSGSLKFNLARKQSIFDILPTILRLQGIPLPVSLDGKEIEFRRKDSIAEK
jgi:predicted AlkP superfamily phosphohydrolase/phosphomutase